MALRSARARGRYAIIVDGQGDVTERRLADHAPGAVLPPSVAVTGSTVADGVRTVTLKRPVAGGNYSLPIAPGDLSLITAVGSTPTLAYAANLTHSWIISEFFVASHHPCPPAHARRGASFIARLRP